MNDLERQILLRVRDLTVDIRSSGGLVQAVRGISYEIGYGESVALVGESGCGKTVSALALLGLLPTSAVRIRGSAEFAGTDLVALPTTALRRLRGNRIAMIFQDPLAALNPVAPIGRQLLEALRTHTGIRGSAATRRAVELLEMVEIPDARRRLREYPHELSGGMRQRVVIAAALSCQPDLLIADEPTTALDVTIQSQVLELLARLRQQLGMAILLITHDLGVIAGTVERLNVMYAGSIVESGATESVLDAPLHPYTRGLLQSVARLDRPRRPELIPIEGYPPDLRREFPGCAFQPRCYLANARCLSDRPPLRPLPGPRLSACWYAEDVRKADE